jgi:hypothetical protein
MRRETRSRRAADVRMLAPRCRECSQSRPSAIDTARVRSPSCLKRDAIKALATGRCPKNELEAVRRHLAGCARCRAAVVAAASGRRGPGDTVVLKRSGGALRTGFKLGAIALSLLVTGAAWRYGAALKSTDSARPRGTQLQAPLQPGSVGAASDPAMLGEAVATTPLGSGARPEGLDAPLQPASVTEAREPPMPREAAMSASSSPAAREMAEPSVRPVVHVAPPSVRPVDVTPPTADLETRQPARAQGGPAGPAHSPPASAPRPATARGASRKDEFDFGID